MSTAATVTPPPMPPSGAGRLDDFSDKLSPMLVKELRQGLRAKTFVIVFLALQGLMTVVLLAAVSASPDRAGQSVSSVIFFFFSLAVLVVQPLRGIGALHNEIRGSTIDLMVLTRMNAWRIVLGKLVAIVSQSALLLTAIVPYLILRYFFGQMNLFAELLLLGLVFAGSAVFTAFTVGVSPVPSILVRGLLPLFIAVALAMSVFNVIFDGKLHSMISFCSLQGKDSGSTLMAWLLCGAYIGWSALSMGASMIAPMAENHSTARRIVALVSLLLAGVLCYAGHFRRDTVGPLLLLFCAPAVAIALTEPLNLLPPMTRPFIRRGSLGRIAGRILYPGWPAGVIFTGLLLATGIGAFLLNHGGKGDELGVFMISSVGTLLFPAVIMLLFGRKVRQAFPLYLLILVITCGAAIAATLVVIETLDDSWVWLFSWIPPVQLVVGQMVASLHYNSYSSGGAPLGPPDLSSVITVGIVSAAVHYLIILVCAVLKFPAIREVENEATSNPAPET